MNTRIAKLSIVLFLTACGGASASSASGTTPSGTYEIHLTRHTTVGFAWNETTHFTQTQRTLVRDASGATVGDTTQGAVIDLSGAYTVLAVDATGMPAQLRLDVRSMTVDAGQGAVAPSLPPALIIDRAGEGTITGAQGEPLEPAMVTLLREVVPDRAPPVDDDLVFGTRTPQAVGASWAIDSQGAARGLTALSLSVTPENVAGETTLVAARREGGHDVLELRSTVTAHHVGMPGLPPGSVEQRADVIAGIDMLLPTDPTLPPVSETERAAIDIEVLVPTPAGQQTVDVTVQQEGTHQRTFP